MYKKESKYDPDVGLQIYLLLRSIYLLRIYVRSLVEFFFLANSTTSATTNDAAAAGNGPHR